MREGKTGYTFSSFIFQPEINSFSVLHLVMMATDLDLPAEPTFYKEAVKIDATYENFMIERVTDLCIPFLR